MRVRVWLVLIAALPLLAVGSGASTAGTPGPPRNGLIAAFGGDGIYLIDAQRAKARKVPGTDELGEPAWSPDGSLLAVEGWDKSGSIVYTIRPDGSDRRVVLRNAWSPSWSPDGKRLVVAREGAGAGAGVLVTVQADGSDAQQVAFDYGKDGANAPVWSPDGKWIAFFSGDGGVKLVSPNGSDDGVRTITDNGSDSGWNLAWSPDASKLAFDTLDKAHDYRQVIAVFDLTRGRRTILPSLPNHPISAALAWSPDGKQLTFLSSAPMRRSSGGCGGEMPMDLWVMNADGSEPHLVSKGNYGPPSWGTFRPAPKPAPRGAGKRATSPSG
jgi:Tol biopolymer transport system component